MLPSMLFFSLTIPRMFKKHRRSRIGTKEARQHNTQLLSTASAVLPNTMQGTKQDTMQRVQLPKQPKVPFCQSPILAGVVNFTEVWENGNSGASRLKVPLNETDAK